MTSNVDQWLEALERIRAARTSTHVVPGHGPVVTLEYVQTQRAVLLAWKAAVADAVAKGWSREETIARVRFDDAFGPVDVGQALHDGSHPEQQRRLALGQAHGHGVREGPLRGLAGDSVVGGCHCRSPLLLASSGTSAHLPVTFGRSCEAVMEAARRNGGEDAPTPRMGRIRRGKHSPGVRSDRNAFRSLGGEQLRLLPVRAKWPPLSTSLK